MREISWRLEKHPYDFELCRTKSEPPLLGGGSSCILKNVEFNFTEFRFNIIWRGSAWPGSTMPWRPNTMILQNGILDVRCESYII